jgi:hypothetical protein
VHFEYKFGELEEIEMLVINTPGSQHGHKTVHHLMQKASLHCCSEAFVQSIQSWLTPASN